MKDDEIYLEQLSNEVEIDIIKFGDILNQFGGLEHLRMYEMVNYIHKHYVNKKVKIYLNLNGENQMRIFYVKKFLKYRLMVVTIHILLNFVELMVVIL